MGVSALDPEGNGHQGIKAIEKFYDMTVGAAQVTIDLKSSHPAGNECANVMHITTEYPNGVTVKVHAVTVYQSNEHGKLISLRAFWDFDEALEQL